MLLASSQSSSELLVLSCEERCFGLTIARLCLSIQVLRKYVKKIALSELWGLKRQIRSQRMHKGAEFEFGAGFECIQSRFIFLFIE